jgi:hypothetical protein
VRLEGLGNLEKSNDIGIRTRYLPACSIVPQPRYYVLVQTLVVTLNFWFSILKKAVMTKPILWPPTTLILMRMSVAFIFMEEGLRSIVVCNCMHL